MKSVMLFAFFSSVLVFAASAASFITDDGKITCSYGSTSASCSSSESDVDSDCLRRLESLLVQTATIESNISSAQMLARYNIVEAEDGLDYLSSVQDLDHQYELGVARSCLENIAYMSKSQTNYLSTASTAVNNTYSILRSFECSSIVVTNTITDVVTNYQCCCSCGDVDLDYIESSLSNISVNVSSVLSDVQSLHSTVVDLLSVLYDIRFGVSDISSTVSNILSVLSGSYGGSTTTSNSKYWRYRINDSTGNETVTKVNSTISSEGSRNVIAMLGRIQVQLTDYGSSLNNYLHKISFVDFLSISNDVSNIAKDVRRLESIDNTVSNFYSFFRSSVSVDGVLGDYSGNDGYFYFLTNHYLKVVNGESSSLSFSQSSKTNWFSRIETLIASLVFSDSAKALQTEEDSSSDSIVDDFETNSDIMNSQPVVQMGNFGDASRSVLSSISSFSSLFSEATIPSHVRLFSLPSSGSDSSDVLQFETSEMSSFVEVCRCVTTLCWTFIGLFVSFYFMHWCLMTSYRLLVFCYSVLSSVFGH